MCCLGVCICKPGFDRPSHPAHLTLAIDFVWGGHFSTFWTLLQLVVILWLVAYDGGYLVAEVDARCRYLRMEAWELPRCPYVLLLSVAGRGRLFVHFVYFAGFLHAVGCDAARCWGGGRIIVCTCGRCVVEKYARLYTHTAT